MCVCVFLCVCARQVQAREGAEAGRGGGGREWREGEKVEGTVASDAGGAQEGSERERAREREPEKEKEREGQAQTQRHRGTETQGRRDAHTETHTDTDRHIDTHARGLALLSAAGRVRAALR
eukprot:740274-Rhodomonas_salina.2